jgi:hypothetical protein
MTLPGFVSAPVFSFLFFSCKTDSSSYCFAPGTHQDQGFKDFFLFASGPLMRTPENLWFHTMSN